MLMYGRNPTQYCKPIIFQSKIKIFYKESDCPKYRRNGLQLKINFFTKKVIVLSVDEISTDEAIILRLKIKIFYKEGNCPKYR